MDSLKLQFQAALKSPAVKKLRALEQRRLDRMTAQRAVTSERRGNALEHIDAAAKTAIRDAATRRAEDLRTQAQDLADLVEALTAEDA